MNTNNNNIAQTVELSIEAKKRILALREMEKDGISHEKFFLEVLTLLSCEMSNLADADTNKRFREYFDTLTYYSNTLTSLVQE